VKQAEKQARREAAKEALAGIVLILLLAAGATSPAKSQDASPDALLEQCRALNETIEHYTTLRRKGGSASRMEGWKERLREAEAEFREKDCREYRREWS